MNARRRTGKRGKKKRYTVIAPQSLGGRELHDVLAADDDALIGRTYEPLLYDLTEDVEHQNIVLTLKIVEVQGNNAFTIYAGHRYVREYRRSLVIRGTSLVKTFTEVRTKDGYRYRVNSAALTVKRINSSKMTAIRKKMSEIVRRRGEDLDNDSFIKELILERVAAEIYGESKQIAPLRHVGVMKVKLLEVPEQKDATEITVTQ